MFILNTGDILRAGAGQSRTPEEIRRQQELVNAKKVDTKKADTTTQAQTQGTKEAPPKPVLTETAKLLAAVIKTGQVGLIKVIADTYLPLLYEQGKEAAKVANLDEQQKQKLDSPVSTTAVRQGMLSTTGTVAATDYILNDPKWKKLFPEPVIRTAAKVAEAITKGLNNNHV